MIKGKFLSLAVGAAVLASAGAGVLAVNGAAFASGGGGPTPPWESSISPPPNGFITFYNAKGQVVTGGSTTDNGLGAYAVASTADIRSGDTKAELFMYTPVSGQNPGTWSGEQISSSTNYPNASAPAPIGTATNPAETNPGTDITIQNYIAAFPNTQTATGYVGLYDVRLKVSGPGIGLEPQYWDAVISVDTVHSTWSVDYPDWTQNTTTGLVAVPPSPQTAPASPVTLTATVAPATAGTVSFWSGSTQVGTTQTVTGINGVASVMTTPPTGTTPYQAIFTPAVASADIGSASTTLNYVVSNVTAPPNWEPTLFGPAGPGTARVGGLEYCVASFQSADTVAYAWQANGTPITGQTASTFTPSPSLLGESLTCSVQATNAKGSVSGMSTGATVAIGAALVPTVNPKLSGPHRHGQVESVSAGTWSPAATTVTYQWYLGATKVTGATKSTFKLPSSSTGKKVHCVVTASATGYTAGVYTTPSLTIV